MYVGAVLAVLGVLVLLVSRDTLRDDIADDRPELTSSELDTAIAVTTVVAVVGAVIGVALWLWMASANGQGKSWARIVASVLGGLNVLFTLTGLATNPQTAASLVFSLVGLVLAAVILVLLWRPESSRFYEARQRLSGPPGGSTRARRGAAWPGARGRPRPPSGPPARR